MLSRFFFLILISLPLLAAEQSGITEIAGLKLPTGPSGPRVYLNLGEGKFHTIFNMPGKDWKSCDDINTDCRKVDWLNRDSEIYLIEEKPSQKINGKEYKYITYKHTRPDGTEVFGVGWIDSSPISYKKLQALPPPKAKQEDCNPHADTATNTLQEIASAVTPLTEAINKFNVEKAAESLRPLIGKCVIDPKVQPEGTENNYDTYALPTILKVPLPKNLVNENGTPISRKELIAIDAIARTLYGEACSCFAVGLEYPTAAIKVALNRVDLARANSDSRAAYIKGEHSPEKGDFAKVMTTGSQFNVWWSRYKATDKTGKEYIHTNNSIRKALCPPSDNKKKYWQNELPSNLEKFIWTHTLRIATEAVLAPKRFRARTSEVTQTNYSSYMENPWSDMVRVYPSIEGKKIEDGCIQIWQLKNKAVAKK